VLEERKKYYRDYGGCHKGLYVKRKNKFKKKTGKAKIGGSFVAPKNNTRAKLVRNKQKTRNSLKS